MLVFKKRFGLVCLIIGGLAWPLGFAAHYEVPQILPVHLAFIFAGIGLRGSHLLEVIMRRRESGSK